jgi:hypothetical protein
MFLTKTGHDRKRNKETEGQKQTEREMHFKTQTERVWLFRPPAVL